MNQPLLEKQQKTERTRKCSICCSVCGLIVLLLGVLLPVAIESLLQEGLDDELIVSGPDSTSYEGWLDNYDEDDPIEYENIYVFNITNFEDVLNGARPNVIELGPYVYRKNWQILTQKPKYMYDGFPWYDCDCPVFLLEGEVAYYQRWVYYTFLPDDTPNHPITGAKLDPWNDMVYSPSIPYLAAVPYLGENVTWSLGGRLYHRLSVHELTWGYIDPLLQTLLNLGPGPIDLEALGISPLVYFLRNYTSIQDTLDNAPFEGWRTGKLDSDRVNDKVITYGQPYVDYWRERQYVFGTSGMYAPRGLKKGGEVFAWDDNTMRTVPFVNYDDREVTIKGIDLIHYQVLKEGWLPASMFPLNEMYYQDNTPVGLLNLTQLYAAPVYATRPHYLECDPAVAETVSGLKGWEGWDEGEMIHTPDYDTHDIVLDIEPYSGITMNGALRLQIVVETFAGTESAPNDEWLPWQDIPYPSPLQVNGHFNRSMNCPGGNLIGESFSVETNEDGAVSMTSLDDQYPDLRGSIDYLGDFTAFGPGTVTAVLCTGLYFAQNDTINLACVPWPSQTRTCYYTYLGYPENQNQQIVPPTPPTQKAYPEAYQNLRHAYVPIIWIEEAATITDDLADEFKGSIILALDMSYGILIAGCTLGSLMILGGAYGLWKTRKQQADENQLITNSAVNRF